MKILAEQIQFFKVDLLWAWLALKCFHFKAGILPEKAIPGTIYAALRSAAACLLRAAAGLLSRAVVEQLHSLRIKCPGRYRVAFAAT